MVSKTIVVLAIILLVLSVVALGVVIMNAPKTSNTMTQSGTVSAQVVVPAEPMVLGGKVVANVVA